MGVLDEIKAISAQLGLGFGLSLAIYPFMLEKVSNDGCLDFQFSR